MSKFVAAIAEIPGAVNFTFTEFQKAVVEQGGAKSAIEYYVDRAVTEFAEEREIYIVEADTTIAEGIVGALNASYNERAEAQEVPEPSYVFAGAAETVAYGGEAVSNNDTAAAAIANIESTKQSKGEVNNMNTNVINNLAANGVNDSDALAIAMKLKEAAGKAAGTNQTKSNVKENVQMNNRRGTTTVTKEEETQAPVQGGFVFGGTKQNNNGGNNMNTQTQGKEETKETAPTNRRGSGSTGAPAGNTPAGNGPSFTFNGSTQDTVNNAGGLTGWDATDRESELSDGFEGAWYCNPNKYPILKDFMFYFENRRALPVNPYGLTKISFLNPKDKKVVEYDNKYEIVVELSFGKGVNVRIKLTRVTEQMKAEQASKGFRVSKSDWSTGNIRWVEQAGQLAPRYAFSVRNDLALNVKCACERQHTVHTAYATTCKCGKKYEAVKMAPVGESAKLNFSEYQSDWTPVVLNNFNTKVHKDTLALALACAAKERGLSVWGLDEQE